MSRSKSVVKQNVAKVLLDKREFLTLENGAMVLSVFSADGDFIVHIVDNKERARFAVVNAGDYILGLNMKIVLM